MTRHLTGGVLAAALLLAACANVTDQQRATATGGVAGAIGAGVLANLLGASDDWITIASLAGAAAGAVVARNEATEQCYYANGDGTFREAPCP